MFEPLASGAAALVKPQMSKVERLAAGPSQLGAHVPTVGDGRRVSESDVLASSITDGTEATAPLNLDFCD